MGEAGVGKSTFSRRLCVDWAERQQEPSERNQGDDFLFVLPIFLRTVDQGETIRDVFVTHYRIEEKEADMLCSFIDQNQDSVMFILDGLDEFRERTSTEISNLIHKKMYPHVNMLITSRFPSYFVFGNGDNAPEITEFQLRGFSKEGVHEYLRKFYDKKKEEGNALLKKIRQSEDLEYLSHYPAVLLMMATLWHYIPTFNSTMTGFYLDYIKYLIARYEQKYLHFSQWKAPKDILTAYHKQLIKIGDVAIGGLSQDTFSLAFPYDDVIDHIGDATWQLGILVEETCFLRGRTVVFPHKTLQEFFISYRTVHAEEDKQKELLMHFCSSNQAFRESAMIRRFVIGMGGEKLQDHIQTLLSGSDQELARMETELQLDFLAENPKACVALPRVVGLDITSKYPASHYVRYLSQNGEEVERVEVRSREDRHLRLLQHLHALRLSQLELTIWTIPRCSVDAGCINQPWEKTLLNLPLTELSVNCLRDSKDLCAIIRTVVQKQQLRVLTLNRTLLAGEPVRLLIDRLPKSRVVRLALSDCYLSLDEVIHVFQGLPETVTFLDVSDNYFKGLADISDEAIPLQHTRLEFLKMCECDLEPEDVFALIQVVPSTLSELDISRNFAGNGLVKLIEEAEQLVALKSLDLSLNDMSQEVQQKIQESFRTTCPLLNVKIDDK